MGGSPYQRCGLSLRFSPSIIPICLPKLAGWSESKQKQVIETTSIPILVIERKSPGLLLARVSGNWREHCGVPTVEIVRQALGEETTATSLEFDVTALTGWDSRLVTLVGKSA